MNAVAEGASQILAFSIAGIRVRVSPGGPDVHIASSPSRQVFGCPAEEPVDVNISVGWLGAEVTPTKSSVEAGCRLVFDSGQLWRLFREGGGAWVFEFVSRRFGPRPYKVARFSPGFEEGLVLVLREATYDGLVDPLEYPLDELLWIHWLATCGSVELHASGVVDGDGDGQSRSGYIFVGQSGAGKTTTARLWAKDPRWQILSDDRTIVRRYDGQFQLHGTPWHGEGRFARPGSAWLKAIFWLVQAPRTELRPLSPAVAVGRLLSASFPPFHDAGALAATMKTLATLVESTPCYELRFAPDASAVNVVLEHFGDLQSAPHRRRVSA